MSHVSTQQVTKIKYQLQNKEIIEYISKQLALGVTEVEIKRVLIGVGWNEQDIDENIALAKNSQNTPQIQPLETQSVGQSETVHFVGESVAKVGFLKRRSTKIVTVLVLGLLLLGAAAYASYFYLTPSPTKILQQAQQNMQGVKTFDFSGRITVNLDLESGGGAFPLKTLIPQSSSIDERVAGESTTTQIGVDFEGTADSTDENNLKMDLKMNFDASVFTFGFDMRMLDNIIYVKADQLPEIDPILKEFAGIWIKVDLNEITKQFGVAIDLQNGQPDLTENQKQQLEDLVKNAKFFNGITKLANDSIDGVDMYHYVLNIDKAALKSYIQEVNRLVTSAGGFTDQTAEVFNAMEFSNVEVWVGKSDKMPHRISGIVYQKPTETSILASGSLNFVLNMKNFNHLSQIEAPTESRNIMDVIEEATASSQIKSRDARRLSDVRQMMTALELYYNDTGRYPRRLTDMKEYMAVIPTAPTPMDGNCTAENNLYVYTQKSSGQDYSLILCLGTNSGGFDAGLHTASSAGLK